MQLDVTVSVEEYRRAATLLWGPAGTYAADEFTRLNAELFNNELPALPIVIGLTAYGGCIGLTRSGGQWASAPRITLAPSLFNQDGSKAVTDTIVHEMVHAYLGLRGENTAHNGAPWCRVITALSPQIGLTALAAPVRQKRVPNPARERDPEAPKTLVRWVPEEGHLDRKSLATWPHSVRPAGFYADARLIPVPTY